MRRTVPKRRRSGRVGGGWVVTVNSAVVGEGRRMCRCGAALSIVAVVNVKNDALWRCDRYMRAFGKITGEKMKVSRDLAPENLLIRACRSPVLSPHRAVVVLSVSSVKRSKRSKAQRRPNSNSCRQLPLIILSPHTIPYSPLINRNFDAIFRLLWSSWLEGTRNFDFYCPISVRSP